MPDFPLTSIRSVELATPDLARAARFYTQVWGLSEAGTHDGALLLRATGPDHHVLALREGPRPELRAVTYRAASAAALAGIRTRAEAAGCPILCEGEAHYAAGGGEVLAFRSPQECVIRVVHSDRLHGDGREMADRPHRLSHVNLNTRDVDATLRFYQDVLGMRMTDRSAPMGFLRCNADHHCMVLAQAPHEGLNHVAFMMPDLESVMRGAGRMIGNGHSIGWGVGRHGPGNNVFAYFVDPGGIVIEYTAEVEQVDDGYRVGGPADWVWPPGRTDRWGIAPPKSEETARAQLAVRFG